MADFPTFKELFQIARAELLVGNSKLRPEAVDTPGTNVNILANMMSMVGEQVVRQAAIAMSRAIPSLTKGEYLDRLAWDWYGLTRKPATMAQCTLTFSREDASKAGTIPAGTVVSTPDHSVSFTTDLAVDVPSGTASVQVQATCTVAGSIGNVAAGQLTVIDTALFDTFQVTNDEAHGGEDEETDEELRERMRGYWQAIQRGTLGAIEYGARNVPGVHYAKAVETPGAGWWSEVTLYIADQSGNASSEMISQVQEELINWRPCGVPVDVQGGQPEWVDILVHIVVESGYDTSEIKDRVKDKIISYINTLGFEETLRISALREEIFKAEGIHDATIDTPSADVYPGKGKILRTSLDRVEVQ